MLYLCVVFLHVNAECLSVSTFGSDGSRLSVARQPGSFLRDLLQKESGVLLGARSVLHRPGGFESCRTSACLPWGVPCRSFLGTDEDGCLGTRLSTRPLPPPLPTPLAATLLVASRAVMGTSVPSDWAWIVTRRDSCTLDSEERPPEVILISFRHPVSLLVLRLKIISV